MKDNTDRLLEAVEDPRRFSDNELDMLLKDPDTKDLYETMIKTANLLTETSEPDIDLEWNRFVSKHKESKVIRRSLFINRHVAAVIVTVIASLAVVAASIGIKHSFDSSDATKVSVTKDSIEQMQYAEIVQDSISRQHVTEPAIKVFRDESLEKIVDEISDYYGITASFRTDVPKELHLYFKWDQSQPLTDVLEQLNSFEQINIVLNDNILTVE